MAATRSQRSHEVRISLPHALRTARELALRVLFQVDVGKQPLAEVLDSSLQQALFAVGNPVDEVTKEARAAVWAAALVAAPEGASSSGRRIRNAARMIGLELSALNERLTRNTLRAIKRSGAYFADDAVP